MCHQISLHEDGNRSKCRNTAFFSVYYKMNHTHERTNPQIIVTTRQNLKKNDGRQIVAGRNGV